ncbi:MAG: polysaccharide biosynthesis C-terminal domain-containing protein, partial [Patescibacteria group bacterium]
DPAIPLVFGAAYSSSVLPLQILIASMFFVFLCFPIGALLNACDRQKRHTVNLGLTALASVILNLSLIPILSYNGAAIANLFSYIILFFLGLAVINKIIAYDKKFLFWSGLKIILACAAMFIAAWLVKEQVNFIAAIIVGGAVYLILAYLLRLFSLAAVGDFIKSLKKGTIKKIPPVETL